MKISTATALPLLAAFAEGHLALIEPAWSWGSSNTSACANTSLHIADIEASNTVLNHLTNTASAINLSVDGPAAVKSCGWLQKPEVYFFTTGTEIGCPVESINGSYAYKTCANPMEPTNTDPKLQTYPGTTNTIFNWRTPDEAYKYHPWRAPGFSPVLDACGVVGGYGFANREKYAFGNDGKGFINGHPAPPADMIQYSGGFGASKKVKQELGALEGAYASAPGVQAPPVTEWQSGGVAEVSFGKWLANHGGGYQYRICPASAFTEDGLANDACFEKMPLDYATGKSWIQWGNNTSNRTEFAATRVTGANTQRTATGQPGVYPAGSTWTMNPVPACGNSAARGGISGMECIGTNFPVRAKGAFGFGTGQKEQIISHMRAGASLNAAETVSAFEKNLQVMDAHFDFSVVDKVKVPKGLQGLHVMQWRWDSEQTPQVWTNCAIVNIKQERGVALRGSKRN